MEDFILFGKFFKELRIKKGLTLRQFCSNNGLDPGNISKLERGLFPPPNSKEKLEQYARCLGIQEGTDDWYDFFDKASACKGQIPPDVMSDRDLVEKLPLVFRTLRGQKVSVDKLEGLAELIKKA